MSVVADFVNRLDSQFDHPNEHRDVSAQNVGGTLATYDSQRVKDLLHALKSLSSTQSSAGPLLPPSRVRHLLRRSVAAPARAQTTGDDAVADPFEAELEWLVVTKATVQVQAIVFQTLLDEILPLEDHIGYWEEVLASSRNSVLLCIQTFPGWAWTANRQLLSNAWARRNSGGATVLEAIKSEWRWRSLDSIRRRMGTPVDRVRGMAREHRATLKRVLEARATALGFLMSTVVEGNTGERHESVLTAASQLQTAASVALMEELLNGAALNPDDVGSRLQSAVSNVRSSAADGGLQASDLARRLIVILDTGLSRHATKTSGDIIHARKPSVVVRYWLPATVGILSSSTILRVVFNNRVTIVTWVRESGATVWGFWVNWVVEPVRHLISTIRRDAGSEAVLLSKESLRAERESLERMVVDFVKDHPQYVEDGLRTVSDSQLATIRSKVSEGDITPVLRAYEYGLKKPFQRALGGELVESLLIRVQKVEVVLEATIKGVDSLLEQQQLLFGVIGLAPGMLAVGGSYVYLRRVLSAPSSRSLRNAREGAVAKVRFMREATRLVSRPETLSRDKRQGLLLVEVHRLRALVRGRLPAEVERMLLDDLDEMLYTADGAEQAKVLEHIWRAYGPWLQWYK